MLPQLALILAIAAILLLALRFLGTATPRLVARALTFGGLAGLVALGLWLIVTGKLAGLLAVAIGLSPWIGRLLRLHAFWRLLRHWGIRLGGGRAGAGQTSRVETHFLRMVLDHDSGALDGEVIAGRFKGQPLAALDLAQARELWRDVQADAQSASVLAAWLDRTWPDWREPDGEPPPTASAAMTAEEAWAILGLEPGAGADDIKAAHRRLMRAVHPDQGGSTWLAARINQARDLLLRTHP